MKAGTAPQSDFQERAVRRQVEALQAARDAGHADGMRRGYVQGWRWGVVCGALAGATAAAAVALLLCLGSRYWPATVLNNLAGFV